MFSRIFPSITISRRDKTAGMTVVERLDQNVMQQELDYTKTFNLLSPRPLLRVSIEITDKKDMRTMHELFLSETQINIIGDPSCITFGYFGI